MVWGEVLHEHEGHAGSGLRRHSGEKFLESRQPAGGGADADNGELLTRLYSGPTAGLDPDGGAVPDSGVSLCIGRD